MSSGARRVRAQVHQVSLVSASSFLIHWFGKLRCIVAAIFQQTLTGGPSKPLQLPKATSRAELRAGLAGMPDKARLLELEVDTMGEDWLLALQDEIVKPYFLTVSFDRQTSMELMSS